MLYLMLALFMQDAEAVRGVYLEDRSNHVHGCYCEWSGESQTGGREAILGWRVESGRYRGTELAGMKMALVVRGERTLSMGLTERRSVIVLDVAATAAQKRAASALLRESYGYFLGQVLREVEAPLEIEVGLEAARLRAPGLVAVEMRKAVLPEDALPGAKKWFDPFVPMEETVLGTTLESRYSGREFQYVWSSSQPETSGYFGRFVLYAR